MKKVNILFEVHEDKTKVFAVESNSTMVDEYDIGGTKIESKFMDILKTLGKLKSRKVTLSNPAPVKGPKG